MTEAEHAYTRPRATTQARCRRRWRAISMAPTCWTKTQALRLSTIDAAGWPHAALLSAGDMVVMPPERIRFALFPKSGTAANLRATDRLTLTLSLDGGMCELRLRAPARASAPEVPLAFFEATVETSRVHVAPYAAVRQRHHLCAARSASGAAALAAADRRAARG